MQERFLEATRDTNDSLKQQEKKRRLLADLRKSTIVEREMPYDLQWSRLIADLKEYDTW